MASKRKSNSSEIPVEKRKRRHEDTRQSTDGNDMKVPCMCMCMCMCGDINYVSHLESIFRRVVEEQLALARRQSPSLMPNECGGISEAKRYELRFINELKETYYTQSKISSEGGDPVQIALFDVGSKCMVKDGPMSSIEIEICVVDGDFGIENQNWTREEFNTNILRPRDGKKALLKGKTSITLKGGIGFIPGLKFTDNSSWVRSRTFRLAAKSKEPNIWEAATKPFIVKDKRVEAYKKRHQPSLDDEVWRLRNIRKGGNLHKQLSEAGIKTVKDLMRRYTTNPNSLKEFGDKSSYKWDDIIEHAMACVIDDKEHYIYYATEAQIVFNSIYEVVRVSFDGQHYRLPETFNSHEKQLVERVKLAAYKNEELFIPAPGPVDHLPPPQLDLLAAVQVDWLLDGGSGSQTTFPVLNDCLLSPLASWEQPNALGFEQLNYHPSHFFPYSEVPMPSNARRRTLWNKIRAALKWFILCRLSMRPT